MNDFTRVAFKPVDGVTLRGDFFQAGDATPTYAKVWSDSLESAHGEGQQTFPRGEAVYPGVPDLRFPPTSSAPPLGGILRRMTHRCQPTCMF